MSIPSHYVQDRYSDHNGDSNQFTVNFVLAASLSFLVAYCDTHTCVSFTEWVVKPRQDERPFMNNFYNTQKFIKTLFSFPFLNVCSSLQAMAAASKTVDCLKLVHSIHAYFLLVGDVDSECLSFVIGHENVSFRYLGFFVVFSLLMCIGYLLILLIEHNMLSLSLLSSMKFAKPTGCYIPGGCLLG